MPKLSNSTHRMPTTSMHTIFQTRLQHISRRAGMRVTRTVFSSSLRAAEGQTSSSALLVTAYEKYRFGKCNYFKVLSYCVTV
ncbi:Protein of unknown function [Gryllus bimaculatus]|nr:Protein of unknown function [Gryllus bimaculatus]